MPARPLAMINYMNSGARGSFAKPLGHKPTRTEKTTKMPLLMKTGFGTVE